jgi:hypothetical protein
MRILGSLDQYTYSEQEHALLRLVSPFEYHPPPPPFPPMPFFRSWEEIEDDEDICEVDVVEDRDKNNADDDGEDIDYWRSSNKFGVTYTESLMTGISFNYSDLYR